VPEFYIYKVASSEDLINRKERNSTTNEYHDSTKSKLEFIDPIILICEAKLEKP
jgi:hypothetical protein